MQAVILAAGKGTRLQPLTNTTPKPLLHVGGKPLIEHVLDALPDTVTNVIVVVNYLHEQLEMHLGNTWNNKSITYVFQDPLNGTAGALHQIKELLDDSFLVLNADDLYQKKDLEKLQQFSTAMLVKEHEPTRENAAECQNGLFVGFTTGTTVVCGAYMLSKAFFDLPLQPIANGSTELGIPHTLASSAQTQSIQTIPATQWLAVGTPEQLEAANKKYT